MRKYANYKPPLKGERKSPNDLVLHRARKYLENHDINFEHEIPTIPGLATVLQLPMGVVNEWRGKAETDKACGEFDELCDLIEGKLHHVLLHDGMQKQLQPAVASLALQSLYRYSTKEQITGKDEGPVRIKIDVDDPVEVERRYTEIMRSAR